MCRRDTATQFSNETLISIYWRLFIICFYLPSCASAFPDLLERPEFSSGLSNCLNSFYCRQFVNKLQAIKKYTTSLLVQSSLIVKPIWICDVQVTILLDVKESETVVCARGISILRIRHVCFGIGHLVSKNIEKHLMLLDSHKKKKTPIKCTSTSRGRGVKTSPGKCISSGFSPFFSIEFSFDNSHCFAWIFIISFSFIWLWIHCWLFVLFVRHLNELVFRIGFSAFLGYYILRWLLFSFFLPSDNTYYRMEFKFLKCANFWIECIVCFSYDTYCHMAP